MASTVPQKTWLQWLERWEAQQGGYMPDREERFDVIIDAVAALGGAAPHVVDLGCGPGSLARRLLDRLPDARVTAIDMDPVLLAIGRNALGDRGGRLRWLDADLRSQWLPGEPAHAAVSTTALHWLQPGALAGLYRHLATVLLPGGVFINGDRMDVPDTSPRIAAAVAEMRRERSAATESGGESWDQWWAAVEAEPAVATEVAERNNRHHDHPDHEHPLTVVGHTSALLEAGFSEVEVIWQHLSDRVLLAVR